MDNIPVNDQDLIKYVEIARKRGLVGQSASHNSNQPTTFRERLNSLPQDCIKELHQAHSLRSASFVAKNKLFDLTFQEISLASRYVPFL